MGLFLDCFGELPDPRRGNARRPLGLRKGLGVAIAGRRRWRGSPPVLAVAVALGQLAVLGSFGAPEWAGALPARGLYSRPWFPVLERVA